MRRADLDADAAAGAVLHIELQREPFVWISPRIDGCRLEACWCAFQFAFVVVLGTNHAVRAGEPALAALHAKIRVPDCHDIRDVALLESCGARREGPVDGHLANADVVTAPEHHLGDDLVHELRRLRRHDRGPFERARCGDRHGHFEQMGQRVVDRLEILAHNVSAFRAVGFLN